MVGAVGVGEFIERIAAAQRTASQGITHPSQHHNTMSTSKRANLQTLVDKGIISPGAQAEFYHNRILYNCDIFYLFFLLLIPALFIDTPYLLM